MDAQHEMQAIDPDWQMIFTYLPTSGAAIHSGILEPGHVGPRKRLDREAPSQVEMTELITHTRRLDESDDRRIWLPREAAPPTSIMMMAGGNDTFFSKPLKDCIKWKDSCTAAEMDAYEQGGSTWLSGTRAAGMSPIDFTADMHERLADALYGDLPRRHGIAADAETTAYLDELQALDRYTLPLRPMGSADSSGIFLASYPDPLQDDDGSTEANCMGMMKDWHARWMLHAILLPLNDVVAAAADAHDYELIDLEDTFAGRGACSSSRLVHSVKTGARANVPERSGGVQGGGGLDLYDPDCNTSAIMHPNRDGFRAMAAAVSPTVVSYTADIVSNHADRDLIGFDTESQVPAQGLVGDANVVVHAVDGVRLRFVIDGIEYTPRTSRAPLRAGWTSWSVSLPEPTGVETRMVKVYRSWRPASTDQDVALVSGGSEDGIPLASMKLVFAHSPRDTDGDGVWNYADKDDDNDKVVDTKDNCPTTYNPSQLDSDRDGIGDACDSFIANIELIARIEALREVGLEQKISVLPSFTTTLPDDCLACLTTDLKMTLDAVDAHFDDAAYHVYRAEKLGTLVKHADGTLALPEEAFNEYLLEGGFDQTEIDSALAFL